MLHKTVKSSFIWIVFVYWKLSFFFGDHDNFKKLGGWSQVYKIGRPWRRQTKNVDRKRVNVSVIQVELTRSVVDVVRRRRTVVNCSILAGRKFKNKIFRTFYRSNLLCTIDICTYLQSALYFDEYRPITLRFKIIIYSISMKYRLTQR